MAHFSIKLYRVCGVRWNKKYAYVTLLLSFILVCKFALFDHSTPRLYKVALQSIKEGDVLNESNDNVTCHGRIININSYVVLLRGVTVDPSKSTLGRSSSIHVRLNRGFFEVNCKGDSSHLENSLSHHATLSHFPQWASSVIVSSHSNLHGNDLDLVEGYTVAVKRRTPTNSYFRMLDMYNTYVTVRLIGQNPDESLVLFLDGYAEHTSDILWSMVFSEVSQMVDINRKRLYEHVVWAIPAALGPLETRDHPYPYLEDFSRHVVDKAGADSKDPISCRNLRITLLAETVGSEREEYGHYRLANADEVVKRLRQHVPRFEITALQPKESELKQIEIYATTDILIGMHGDELVNTVLLRKGSALIELFPTWYRISSDNRFRDLSEWKHVLYANWYNRGLSFSDMYSMTIDPEVIVSLVDEMRLSLCPGSV